MDEDREGMRNAPQPDPDWLDHSAFAPGVRAFQRNSVAVLLAFVTGVLIDGFSTLISKSFVQTGRIFDNGVWRLRQNNRHQMEIFWPGGLERHGDGWKLSVRIRFVHAQIRLLLAQTEEWEHDAWGLPVSAAHLGYAIACFAARSLKHSEALVARYSPEERASFHAVWRYSGYLMGIPETILFTDESHALHIYRIGSNVRASSNAAADRHDERADQLRPLVAGIEDTEKRKKLVKSVIYSVSRGLIGKDLADQLNFPANRLPFALLWFRLDQRIQSLRARLRKEDPTNFSTLLVASAYDDAGLSYRLPDHAHAERSGKW